MKEKKISQRDIIALKLEDKRIKNEENLTFKPNLTSKTVSNGNNLKSASTADIGGDSRFDRLYKDAMKRQQVSDSKPVDDNLSFKPKISARASSRGRAQSPLAVSDRLYNSASSKSIAPPPPSNPEETFKPKISKRAGSVDRSKTLDVNDRLYQMNKDHLDRLEKLRQSVLEQTSVECTFAPKVRASSSSKSRPSSSQQVCGYC